MKRWETLNMIGLFVGLNLEELEGIAQICEERNYNAGEKIFTEDTPGTELYILRKGKVLIELATKGRDTTPVHLVEEGQVFGELALIDQGTRSATAKAITDCDVLVLKQDKFYQLCEKNNHIGYVVIKNIATVMASRLRKTNLQLLSSLLWK